MTDEDFEDDSPPEPVEGHFTSLFNAVERPPSWVITDLIPEGLTVIGGPPKDAKKSTLVLAVAALTAGYKCEVLPPTFKAAQGGPALVWSYEADADEIKHTATKELLIKLEDDDGILICDTPEEYLLDDPEGMQQMLHWLDARKPRLAIIDPLRNAHSLDEKESGEIARILIPLRRWAKRNSAAVIVVHHTRKLEEDKQYTAQDLRGSSALYGLADGIIMITPLNGKPMQFQYQTTFKRGTSWNRTLQLAAYETKGQRAGEALREVDKVVLKTIEQLESANQKQIAVTANLSVGAVGERLAFLLNNGYATVKDGIWRVIK